MSSPSIASNALSEVHGSGQSNYFAMGDERPKLIQPMWEFEFRIAVLGDSHVGKSALLIKELGKVILSNESR
jgi:hypothetical protein